jgi:hypothetical protein
MLVFCEFPTNVGCLLYRVQANPGTTTYSQPPNGAAMGMNGITPPRIEAEEQEVIKMQHVNKPNACPNNIHQMND